MAIEEMNKLKSRVVHQNATSLDIKRVPMKTAELFKQYANDEFVGDYGMALKAILEQVLLEPQKFQQIYSILEEHEQRLSKLENRKLQTIKTKKTISGKEIKIPSYE